jgi:hypothetical protein
MEAPTDIQKLVDQVQQLLAENRGLRQRIAEQQERIAELERRLGLNRSYEGATDGRCYNSWFQSSHQRIGDTDGSPDREQPATRRTP